MVCRVNCCRVNGSILSPMANLYPAMLLGHASDGASAGVYPGWVYPGWQGRARPVQGGPGPVY